MKNEHNFIPSAGCGTSAIAVAVSSCDGSGYRTIAGILWPLLFCIMTGIFSASCVRHKESGDRPAPSVDVAYPVEEDSVVVYNSYPATLESESKADVVARVNGQILGKHFENGALVKKGQPLFTIESTIYAASVNEAKAQVTSASGQLDYARKHLAALESAFGANAVSEMDVIQARAAERAAVAQLNQAKAALATASTRLGYCTVVAPVSGRISAATLDVGAYANGEASPVVLATIYDESDLAACFSITDYDYTSISSQGDGFADPLYRRIPIYITASEDVSAGSPCYFGDLNYESPSVEPTSGNMLLKAKILDGRGGLRPGMYGRVMLPAGVRDNAVLINDASISTDQRGKYVYLVNDSNKVVYTPVEVGELYNDTLRLITKGVRPTDRYVVRAMMSVRNGEKVRPVVEGTSSSAVSANKD